MLRASGTGVKRSAQIMEEVELARPDRVMADVGPPRKVVALADKISGKPMKPSSMSKTNKDLKKALEKSVEQRKFCNMTSTPTTACHVLMSQISLMQWQEKVLTSPDPTSAEDEKSLGDLKEQTRRVHELIRHFWHTTLPEEEKRARILTALKSERNALVAWAKTASKNTKSVAKSSAIDPLDRAAKVGKSLQEQANGQAVAKK